MVNLKTFFFFSPSKARKQMTKYMESLKEEKLQSPYRFIKHDFNALRGVRKVTTSLLKNLTTREMVLEGPLILLMEFVILIL